MFTVLLLYENRSWVAVQVQFTGAFVPKVFLYE